MARKHLDRHDFAEARRALKEVFNKKYDDPDAASLKAQIDAREKEVENARTEKESLYSNALRHNQSGEISSALSKLEKLLELSRNVPGASVPERDKVFQAFYNDVRTERERVDNAYSEGSLHLSEKNFAKALAICDNILTRYPHNPQFQALRLKVEHSQRQELSAYIAELGRAVDTEPNLDRRVGLLEEACKRYPNEDQFSRQLSLACELRDLVNSIVQRARNYEEMGQFPEAITQWTTLTNIHPQYPGIDFEINQLERRREQQTQEDKKARLVEKIDRALGNAAYQDAERLSLAGLEEFPQNPELQALLRLSRNGLEQTQQANRLFEEAKTRRSYGDMDQAIALTRQALDLDKRNIVIQNTLVNLLTERAHALLDTDPAAAEPLAAEAGRLDPEYPSVTKVIALIGQTKRKNFVEQTVAQARELQNSNRNDAINVLKEGLSVYPGDGRLTQTLSSLQREEALALGATAFGVAPPAAEAKTVVYPAEAPNSAAPPPAGPPVKPPLPPSKPKQQSSAKPPAPPRVPPPPPPSAKQPPPPSGKSFTQKVGDAGNTLNQNLQARFGKASHPIMGVILGLLAFIIVVGAYFYLHRSTKPPENTEPPVTTSGSGSATGSASYQVHLDLSPSDAALLLDGSPVTGNMTPLLDEGSTHRISVSRPGYQTIENPSMKVTGPNWKFNLEPQPLHINLSVSDAVGTVWLDDQQVDKLDNGVWSSSYPIKSSDEHHVLMVKGKNGSEILKVAYSLSAGKLPVVEPLGTKDLLVTSSLGKDAVIYSGNSSSKVVPPGDNPEPIPPSGLPVSVQDASTTFNVANGKSSSALTISSGAAPSISISLNASSNVGQATITVTPKEAKLYVDGGMIAPKKPGFWSWLASAGNYKAKLTAPGMADMAFNISVKKDTGFTRHFDMTPSAPVGPSPATLIVNGGEPNASISIDGTSIGTLDDKGNGRFATVSPGTRAVQISKEGYAPLTVSGIQFAANKPTTLPGNKRLSLAVAYVRISSLSPPQASVSYHRVGESEIHKVVDTSQVVKVTPGTYEFTADDPKYVRQTRQVRVLAEQTGDVTFALAPLASDDSKTSFVDPSNARKSNGDWYHGFSNSFVPLTLHFRINSILFSKELRQKKMTWRIGLNGDNYVTYTFDGKNLSVESVIDGDEKAKRKLPVDLDGTGTASKAWVIQIRLEKNTVVVARQGGAVVDAVPDDKHDWSHAQIAVKGDVFFTVWPGS